jgi:predicted DNA-binding ribbon-helix-helix protein
MGRDMQVFSVVSRSVRFGSHSTSVSLEEPFRDALREIATKRDVKVGELVEEIDERRRFKNLSSALRVFVLEHYIAQIPRHRRSTKPMHTSKRGRPAKRAAHHP